MPPLIHHFIVRPEVVKRLPTGLVVEQPLIPLIPLDELPEWLDLIGIPRQLTPEQTAGLSNLGCFERQGVHDVEIIIDEPESDAGADDAEQTPLPAADIGKPPAVVSAAPATAQPGLQHSRWADAMNDHGVPCKPEAARAAMHPADRMMAHTSAPPTVASASTSRVNRDTQASTTTQQQPSSASSTASSTASPRQTKPSTDTSSPGKKRNYYCRHWVHHGTCKWGPYCRFAHTMPATAAGLSEVGLRDFPAWWTVAAGQLAARKMCYRDVGGMGYAYGGLPGGFALPGYGPGPGGYVAAGGDHGWKEGREVHPRVRAHVFHERERVRKVRAGVGGGGGGGVPGMRNLEGAEKVPGGGVGQLVARGSVGVGEDKRRELLELQMRQVQQQQVAAHKLVDV